MYADVLIVIDTGCGRMLQVIYTYLQNDDKVVEYRYEERVSALLCHNMLKD